MFTLNPGSSGGEKGTWNKHVVFFGRLGLYFAAIRTAYLFFGPKENKTLLK